MKTNLILCSVATFIALSLPVSANTDNSLETAVKSKQIQEIKEVYVNQPNNSTWEVKEVSAPFYDNPYQVSIFSPQNGEDSERLWSQTKSIFMVLVLSG
jgi:hypothetical protein